MIGMSFAAVPLYRIFCSETGYAGTTAARRGGAGSRRQRRAGDGALRCQRRRPISAGSSARSRTQVAVHPGEQTLITYHAVNKTKEPLTGTATFNVTPFKAGIYFNKIQCFCFTKQHLEPGESADLAVSFFVDPDMLTDPGTRDVQTITLSYTMFRAKDDGQPGRCDRGRWRQNTASNANDTAQPTSVI